MASQMVTAPARITAAGPAASSQGQGSRYHGRGALEAGSTLMLFLLVTARVAAHHENRFLANRHALGALGLDDELERMPAGLDPGRNAHSGRHHAAARCTYLDARLAREPRAIRSAHRDRKYAVRLDGIHDLQPVDVLDLAVPFLVN